LVSYRRNYVVYIIINNIFLYIIYFFSSYRTPTVGILIFPTSSKILLLLPNMYGTLEASNTYYYNVITIIPSAAMTCPTYTVNYYGCSGISKHSTRANLTSVVLLSSRRIRYRWFRTTNVLRVICGAFRVGAARYRRRGRTKKFVWDTYRETCDNIFCHPLTLRDHFVLFLKRFVFVF